MRCAMGLLYLAGFVLGDFVLGVLLAVFALAIGAAGLMDEVDQHSATITIKE